MAEAPTTAIPIPLAYLYIYPSPFLCPSSLRSYQLAKMKVCSCFSTLNISKVDRNQLHAIREALIALAVLIMLIVFISFFDCDIENSHFVHSILTIYEV